MKDSLFILLRGVHALALAGLFVFLRCEMASAQTNSWIGSGGGDWESPEWSDGLPAANEDIFITNAALNLIVIESTTARSYPQTLNIGSLTLSAPSGSSSELLMNDAGTNVPLVIGDINADGGVLVISDTNSAFVMVSSALEVNNAEDYATAGTNGAFSVGGAFYETANSVVQCRSIHVGNIAPGVFYLTNSTFNCIGAEYVGGNPSSFNQNGGQNSCALLGLNEGGQYNLYDGSFSGEIDFAGGSFTQWEGNAIVNLNSGWYGLHGGTVTVTEATASGVNVFGGTLYATNATLSGLSQSGGTSYVMALDGAGGGADGPVGSFNISGGSVSSGSVYLGYWEGVNPGQNLGYGFSQSGGYHSTGSISLAGDQGYEMQLVSAWYDLSGGILVSGGIGMSMGYFNQTGGTNQTETISINSASAYALSDGWLTAQSVEVNGPPIGYGETSSFNQSGGTNNVGAISISPGNYLQTPEPYATFSGGTLTAHNVSVGEQCWFGHSGGNLNISGVLTLDGGIWYEQTDGAHLGQLQLDAGTNSVLQLPTNACIMQFADSSRLAWSNSGVLTIVDWNGSLTGHGSSQILFGTNSHALTAQQLGQILFANPAGLPSGNYAASMLADGEIVPSNGPIFGGEPAPFFTGEASLGSGWYYLSTGSNDIFGYYNMQNFPYIFHEDMGWEYYMDASNANHGAYFYDFTDSTFFYAEPGLFPTIYDFGQNTWMFYSPLKGSPGRYTSNPRWFYNYSTQTWVNHL